LGGIKEVHGIPRGGMKLATSLQKHVDPNGRIVAVVDDVLTTGRSMEEKKKKLIEDGVEPGDIYGFVLVRRSQDWTNWIYPFFYVSSLFKD
jgi:orotate phosphoribosyltransferase